METIIGFLAGYLVGAREGKAGLERLKTSVNAIRSSPEVRKMASDAMVLAGQVVRRVPAGGISRRGGEEPGVTCHHAGGDVACGLTHSRQAGRRLTRNSALPLSFPSSWHGILPLTVPGGHV